MIVRQDCVVWDQRSTIHRAPSDVYARLADGEERQLYRTTLVGQPLVGLDGAASESVEGERMLSATEEWEAFAQRGPPVGVTGLDGNGFVRDVTQVGELRAQQHAAVRSRLDRLVAAGLLDSDERSIVEILLKEDGAEEPVAEPKPERRVDAALLLYLHQSNARDSVFARRLKRRVLRPLHVLHALQMRI